MSDEGWCGMVWELSQINASNYDTLRAFVSRFHYLIAKLKDVGINLPGRLDSWITRSCSTSSRLRLTNRPCSTCRPRRIKTAKKGNNQQGGQQQSRPQSRQQAGAQSGSLCSDPRCGKYQRGALAWLRGRCSFCAGRGLGEGQIRHALPQCHCRGAQKVREDMGDLCYQGGGGPWIERRDGACSYDRNFLYDGVVGFWTCGVAAYKEELREEVDDYFMDQGEDLPRYHDDENAVSWLTQPLFVAGVFGSQMVRQLAIWVRASKAFSRHVVPPPAGDGERESDGEIESFKKAIQAEFKAAAPAIKEKDAARSGVKRPMSRSKRRVRVDSKVEKKRAESGTREKQRQTMATFSEIFTPLPASRTAVCHEHGSVVTARSVASHVNSRHRHLAAQGSPADRGRGVGVTGRRFVGRRYEQYPIPRRGGPGDRRITRVERWQEVYRVRVLYSVGGSISRSIAGRSMFDRTRWTNPRKRGGKPGAQPVGGLGEVWVHGVYCRRFGQAGVLQRLFEVTTPANTAASGSGGDTADFQAAIRAEFEAAARAIKEKDEAAAALIGDQSRLSANMWVRHLRGFDREWLATTIRRPVVEKRKK
ncbi:predicted protein [Chaetomium globosum CBS 148.51]|uniref:Uncharacterized protein n=1 Tax=Chaetomium globosum (strain ATCC 6205 / CBS 148.51 / DSM 1962 / NBRC 6347 / NRRL 1970) TaxID=306901 RepID=Q2H7V4_CHAGB|nr:uncharacterized protein CHGG_03700 [Chaetomium globosum CBS 148.51]EAQ91765.1 predicted protein [Chaetomium globosum CBS 148.51]